MNEETANSETQRSPYSGRWVALVRGRIVAQGGTPEQALRASLSSRYKEKPEIIFMSLPFALPPLIDRIKDALPPEQEIYLVGGAVRDLLTSRLSPDLDFALPSNGIALARKVANTLNADFLPLDDERDTGRVVVTNEDGTRTFLDFATYRGANLEEDLRARDFTINALAFNLRDNTILDPLNGANDIRAKLIRACSPTAMSEDPVRILRAVRQAAAFGYKIDKPTREWMKQSTDQLGRISAERLRDEVFKILQGPKPDASIRALEMLGVLQQLMPELLRMKGVEQSPPHIHDVWTHTLTVLDYLDHVISGLRVGYDADKTNDMFTGCLACAWDVSASRSRSTLRNRSMWIARIAPCFSSLRCITMSVNLTQKQLTRRAVSASSTTTCKARKLPPSVRVPSTSAMMKWNVSTPSSSITCASISSATAC